ncbi:hypothetical protein NQZ68_002787 [Dissostichus eleginoides]|nr:hypothetical protein NQZ68_002787 [Dissostichus eleginoides]
MSSFWLGVAAAHRVASGLWLRAVTLTPGSDSRLWLLQAPGQAARSSPYFPLSDRRLIVLSRPAKVTAALSLSLSPPLKVGCPRHTAASPHPHSTFRTLTRPGGDFMVTNGDL